MVPGRPGLPAGPGCPAEPGIPGGPIGPGEPLPVSKQSVCIVIHQLQNLKKKKGDNKRKPGCRCNAGVGFGVSTSLSVETRGKEPTVGADQRPSSKDLIW